MDQILIEAAGETRATAEAVSDSALIELARRIDWSHPIDLTTSFNTRPKNVQRRFQRRLRLIDIPLDLRGKTVLDIGAWDGFFSYECERRGADRVLAIDTYAWDIHGMEGFLLAHEAFRSKVEYRRMDVHELDSELIGKFDIVLFFGVFYHCIEPFRALKKIAGVCSDLLICETHALIPFMHEKYPLVPFFPGDEDASGEGYELCSMPTVECMRQMLKAAGARKIDVKYTPSFKMWKKVMALIKGRPQSGRLIVHANF